MGLAGRFVGPEEVVGLRLSARFERTCVAATQNLRVAQPLGPNLDVHAHMLHGLGIFQPSKARVHQQVQNLQRMIALASCGLNLGQVVLQACQSAGRDDLLFAGEVTVSRAGAKGRLTANSLHGCAAKPLPGKTRGSSLQNLLAPGFKVGVGYLGHGFILKRTRLHLNKRTLDRWYHGNDCLSMSSPVRRRVF